MVEVARNMNDGRSRRQFVAAELVAQGMLQDEIAKRGGFHRKTLFRWRAHPDFQQQLEQCRQADRQTIELQGLTECQARIAQLDQRRLQLIGEVEECATRPEMDVVPGGKTGWLRRGVFVFDRRRFFIYRLNRRVLQEFRELEWQAATRLGQWRRCGLAAATQSTGTGWEFDRPRERAALWIAQGELSQNDIARRCQIDRRTLADWKARPEFQLRVARHHALWAEHCRSCAIARPETRRMEIRMRLNDLKQIQAERRTDPPKQFVCIGNGKISVLGFRRMPTQNRVLRVAELADDPELLTEIAELESHLRDELGG
jgi:transposase